MKMKFGAIVVDGRNKIGGHVASKNRAGAYLRTKVTPVNPQTTAQLAARDRLTTFSQGWRGLTQEERDAWNGAVSNYSKTDIFGDIKNPAGINLYVKLNANLDLIWQTQLTSPPLPEPVSTVQLTAIAAAAGANTFTITLDADVPADTSVLVFSTPGLSPGINFAKSEFRFIQFWPAATNSPINIRPDWTAKFGALVAGQKVFIKVVFVNENTGQQSGAQQLSTIIAA